ncbi:MAG: hypothetical protein P4L45_09885 [Ignavibacteriaceae bacterium]|nr:hypothetical protein [Ignavibacteriaceae bacterium]
MDIRELKEEIAKENENIDKTKIALIPISIEIKSECCTLFKDLIIKKIEDRIKSKPEITKSIGIEKLKELKCEMNQLLETSDSIVNDVIDKNVLCHETYVILKTDYLNMHYDLKNKMNKKLENELQKLTVNIGKILYKYGYIKDYSYTSEDYDEWHSALRNRNYGNGINDFTIYVQLSKSLEQIFDKYINGICEIHNSLCKIRNYSEDIEKLEAEDLWNQA